MPLLHERDLVLSVHEPSRLSTKQGLALRLLRRLWHVKLIAKTEMRERETANTRNRDGYTRTTPFVDKHSSASLLWPPTSARKTRLHPRKKGAILERLVEVIVNKRWPADKPRGDRAAKATLICRIEHEHTQDDHAHKWGHTHTNCIAK